MGDIRVVVGVFSWSSKSCKESNDIVKLFYKESPNTLKDQYDHGLDNHGKVVNNHFPLMKYDIDKIFINLHFLGNYALINFFTLILGKVKALYA